MDFSKLPKNSETINFEPGITEIPDYALASFYNLKEVVVPETVKTLGRGAFQNCVALEKATLPEGLTELPNNLFLHCKMLSKVNIPSTVTLIGDQAFFGVKLKEVKVPSAVTYIGNSAFTGISDFTIRNNFDYTKNKFNIFTWLSEQIIDREADGSIPSTYDFIKNVVITIVDDKTDEVLFKFFIPFLDKFDIFTITFDVFRDNRLDIGLLDSQFQRIRDFENKTNYVYYRISYPYKLSEDNKTMFTRFISANSTKIAERFILDNTVTPLIKLDTFKLIDSTNIDQLIEFANINRKFNSLSYLMEYKNSHFKDRYAL